MAQTPLRGASHRKPPALPVDRYSPPLASRRANSPPSLRRTSRSARHTVSAVYATEELEETAKIFLLLRNCPTRPLNPEQIDDLKSVFQLDF